MANFVLYGIEFGRSRQDRFCASITKISPPTTVLKCPHHEKGRRGHELGGNAEVPCLEDGVREENYLKGSQDVNGALLPS